MNAQTPVILAPGLHAISGEAYHNDPAPVPSLSSTLARLVLNRSPLHAWTAHPRLNPNWQPTESKTFDIGRAAHRAVLGAGGDYVAYPADLLAANGAASTKEAREWAAAHRAAGRTVLKADDADRVEAMAAVAQTRLAAMGINLDPARSEMAAFAQMDGAWVRCMVDNAPADPRLPLYDFKTTEDASPDAIRRSVEAYGYDLQMAHYLAVWEAATGEKRDFTFIFQEKNPPHEIGIARLLNSPGHSADWMEDATEKAAAARRIWAECIRTGRWPGYPGFIIEIGATPYHRQKWQDTQTRAAVSRATIDAATAWQKPE